MTPGAIRFVRYAYPPNALGYCGPDDHQALFEYGAQGVVDGGLRSLAADFEGAWPYLELLAGASGRDPLDGRVVEAYWLGNRLLDRVDIAAFGNSIDDRFHSRAGTSWNAIREAIELGAKPTHAFHVFCVYPWVGLMRSGSVAEPLRILDRCRIRWGRVTAVRGDHAVVESRPLVFMEDHLKLGPWQEEEMMWAADGKGFTESLVPGDLVAMHWGWVCERIGPSALRSLERETRVSLALANRVLARPRSGVLV